MKYSQHIIDAQRFQKHGCFDDSLKCIREFLGCNNNKGDHLSTYEAGGLLIDIGSALFKKELIEEGLTLIEDVQSKNFFNKTYSHEYNVGTAKSALFDASRYPSGIPQEPELRLILEAKRRFYRALRDPEIDTDPKIKCQALINTAHALDACARPTEALQLYDAALFLNPDKYEAHAGKLIAIHWLIELTGQTTLRMLTCAEYHGTKALELQPHAGTYKEYLANKLAQIRSIKQRLKAGIKGDSRPHSPEYRDLVAIPGIDLAEDAFYLANQFYLSEHSIYCRCKLGSNDFLSGSDSRIPVNGTNLKLSQLKPILRLVRRLISEFGQARRQLYHAEREVEQHNADEQYRVSFRTAYGILDKIARIITIFYDDPRTEVIFESFWRGSRPKTEALSGDNPNLFALYSLACDLSVQEGELRFFKDWRNALEHSLLVLTTADPPSQKTETLYVSRTRFRQGLFDLLRLTRSAILSTTFFIQGTRAP